jgi:hypothetical protein
MNRKPYSTGVSDEEYAFTAPYLTLMSEDGSLRKHELTWLLDRLRYVVKLRALGTWHLAPGAS